MELNKEHLLNGSEDKIVQGYINYMVELAQHFGANHSYAQSEVLEIVYFKIKLAQVILISFCNIFMSNLLNVHRSVSLKKKNKNSNKTEI